MDSSHKTSSKKRKHAEIKSVHPAFKLADITDGGPVLVSFPAVEAPSNTSFKTYSRKRQKARINDDGNEDFILVGETDAVEFVTNDEETDRAAQSGCHYLLALHDPRTSSLTVLPQSTPVHILRRTVKALKAIPPAPAPSALQYREARTVLGETFGTKKAKAAIRAQERNHIDVNAMEGVMGYLMDGIDKNAEGLLTHEKAKEAADGNRLIPPFSAEATDPAEIYPLHGIIPELEWKSLSTSAFDQTGSGKERIALLLFRNSSWINAHLTRWGHQDTSSKSKKTTLKLLMYIAILFAFRQTVERQKSFTKDQIQARLNGVSTLIVDGLMSRFTEVPRGSTENRSTSATKTSLLTHTFALCLKVDNYATDVGVIASDLSMSVSEANKLFRSLGCKVTKLTEKDRTRLGLPDSSANTKRAVLSAPVVFPKPPGKRK